MTIDPTAHDRLLLRRLIRPVGNRYEFSLPGTPARTIDRRRVLAVAVGMDALQAR